MMLPFAVTIDGTPIFPEDFSEPEWQSLKESYRVGEFRTPCCATPAIPKTSINQVRFFAHHSDECVTSPESVWHVSTKDRIVRELRIQGVHALIEKPVSGDAGRLKSDVFFEVGQRKISIEVQHSYQTFREYIKRQEKYSGHGIDNYWLLYPSRYSTILKSIARFKLQKDFGGTFPVRGFIACIPELPLALFDSERGDGLVRGGGALNTPMSVWLGSVIRGSFKFVDGAWRVG
jgi:competence CoiA-like predicted nuclease